MSDYFLEPFSITPAYVDGLAAIHIDEAGVARINLYAMQIEADGEMCRILTARLTMPRDVMRAVATRMLTERNASGSRDDRMAIDPRRPLN